MTEIFCIYRKQRKKIFVGYLFIFFVFAYLSILDYIPDTISVQRGGTVSMGSFLPVTKTVKSEDDTVESFGMLHTEECGTYQMECRLLGIIPVKDVTVNIVDETQVIPCGVPIGIYIHSKGVLVVDIAEIETEGGTVQSPSKHILKSGDYITAINGVKITEKEELITAVNASGGQSVILSVNRDGEEISCEVKPVLQDENQYRIGVWVRDDMAGIGTLTYVDKKGNFGALGHSISDTDTDSIVEMSGGKTYLVEILSIIKGEKGNPGELVGQIRYDDSNEIGVIEQNQSNGIFGSLKTLPDELSDTEPVYVGYKQNIKSGPASILVELDGELEYYEIEIESIEMNASEINKSILFQVTDEELIEKTGGIIQGLSGAPIMQDGKIIGAVTHVLVNDPTKGYGIFIEDMLEH